MTPAVEPFKNALNKSMVSEPVISVYSCVDGKRYKNVEHIKRQLPSQVICYYLSDLNLFLFKLYIIP